MTKPGKDILVYGCGKLVNTLAEHDLIDEYRLMVHPVVVEKGKRLFGDTEETKALRLVDTKRVSPDGVLVLTYRPSRDRQGRPMKPVGGVRGRSRTGAPPCAPDAEPPRHEPPRALLPRSPHRTVG